MFLKGLDFIFGLCAGLFILAVIFGVVQVVKGPMWGVLIK